MNRTAPYAIAAALCLAFAPSPAPAQALPLTTALDTCIRSNAPSVAQAEPSLTDGVRFLVEQLCAEELAAYQAQIMEAENQRYRQVVREQCEAFRQQPPKPEDNPDMAAMYGDPCLQLEMMEQSDAALGVPAAASLAAYPIGMAPVNATALGARLLLEARLSRAP